MLIVLGSLLTSCGLMDRFKSDGSNSENIPDGSPEMTMVDSPEEAPATHDNEFDVFSDKPAAKEEITISEPEAPKMVTATPPKDLMPEVHDDMAVDTGPKQIKIYKVKKGETLMQIAFKLYGDIGRWQDLKKLNQEKVSRNTTLATNMTLKYEAPDTEFVWNPEGEPYLIGTGDTLGIISNNVYQTPKRWKSIWENNKPLIKNPNVIYAGFTLYYIKDHNLANYVQPAKDQKPKKEMADDSAQAQESAARESASSATDDTTTF